MTRLLELPQRKRVISLSGLGNYIVESPKEPNRSQTVRKTVKTMTSTYARVLVSSFALLTFAPAGTWIAEEQDRPRRVRT